MEETKLAIKAAIKIKKYNEHETMPFETIEKETVFVGSEATEVLKKIGCEKDVIN